MLVFRSANNGATEELALARIGFTVVDNCSACAPIALALATKALLEPCPRNWCTAASRAFAAALPVYPDRANEPDTGMVSGTVVAPVVNSTVPSRDVMTGTPEGALNAAILSATRPPHPVPAGVFEIELCHCAC